MTGLSGSDLDTLAEVALVAATEAAAMIAGARPATVEHKAGGASLASQVVTAIDRRSEAIIVDRLAPTLDRFGLALLTEERDDDGGRVMSDSFWCIDPLDGTLPFVEGRPGYAVSIALVRRDGAPQIGVVVDPVDGTTWSAVAGAGVQRDGQPWQPERPTSADTMVVYADRSFPGGDDPGHVFDGLDRIAADVGLDGVELRVGAGAVMNACGVLANPPACYVKFPTSHGGGSLWDFAATACLFAEAGAIATDIVGEPLDLNRPNGTSMGHRGVLFATDGDLAARLRALVDERV